MQTPQEVACFQKLVQTEKQIENCADAAQKQEKIEECKLYNEELMEALRKSRQSGQ